MKIETITTIPPQIIQYFSRKLLVDYERPTKPETILRLYAAPAYKKYKEGTNKHREFDDHLAIYEEIYGWIKAKEAYDKAKKKEVSQRPVVPTEAINRLHGKLGKDVRGTFASFISNVVEKP